MKLPSFRKNLSIKGLLDEVRGFFSKIDDKPNVKISLADYLMSGIALFGLKYASLLQFDHDNRDGHRQQNLSNLYGIPKTPSDTAFRERLDEVDPNELIPLYKDLFQQVQRGKGLEDFVYLDGYYLLSLDGTGYFSSKTVHCQQCCEKHHQDGTVTYYHQVLGATLVKPGKKEVLPLAPEPILKQDGAEKNDCERNAAKRLLERVRQDHPHLKLIVIEDALASNAPHIRHLKSLDFRFILGAKESDHKFLYEAVNSSLDTQEYDFVDEAGVHHSFRYLNKVSLNASNLDVKVNFLEYWETQTDGKVQHFAWVTDWHLTQETLMPIMRGGRARWKIENETFNTLKNQGYHFEHNYGHGDRHLTTVLMHLMMLAFLIDQIQQISCPVFQDALQAAGRKLYFWQTLRGRFDNFIIPNWETLYYSIIDPPEIELSYENTS